MKASLAIVFCSIALSSCDRGWHTPLIAAAQSGDADRVATLLRSGANPNQHTTPGYGLPIVAAAARPDNVRVIELLIDAGADVNGLGNIGCMKCCRMTALTAARGVANVRALLRAKADLDPGPAGCAVGLEGSVEEVQELLRAGVDPNRKNWYGVPPLFGASSVAAARVLMGAGSDPRVLNWAGDTAIMWKSTASSLPILLALHEGGVPLVRNYSGQNALHVALSGDPDPEWIRTLLAWGIAVNEKDAKGRKPLWYFREQMRKAWQPNVFEQALIRLGLSEDRDWQASLERRRRVGEILAQAGAAE